MPRTSAVVIQKTVSEIGVGDKLLTDIVGYKGKTLMHRGQTISAREKNWLEKKLKESKPVISSQKYLTNKKAVGNILDKKGNILVSAGKVITEEALKPLLKEGFTIQESFESDHKMFFRPGAWPEDAKYHIDQFNPIVTVETLSLINDDGSPAKNTGRVPSGGK